MRCTQWTLGLLSLNSATCALDRMSTVLSMTRNSRRSAANSRSEFVNVPVGLESDITAAVIAGGHWYRNTVGGIAILSPTMTPPTPNDDASVTPTISGHADTRLRHGVGNEEDSRRNTIPSYSAAYSVESFRRNTTGGSRLKSL